MFGPPFSPSLALGVLHINPFSSISSLRAPERVLRPPSISATVGVGHCDFGPLIVWRSPKMTSILRMQSLFPAALLPFCAGVPAIGVGHGDPVDPVSSVGRVDGASRNIDRPAGVTDAFQISADSVEPTVASLSANLFAHADPRPASVDESKHVGPQMPRIVRSGAFAGDGERLTRAGAGPNRSDPAGDLARDFPKPGAGEEMDALVARDVFGLEVFDASLKDISFVTMPQHCAGDGVKFVERDAHHFHLPVRW